MTSTHLLAEARHCRAQARSFAGQERKLLLRIAELFERMSLREAGERSVEDNRCW